MFKSLVPLYFYMVTGSTFDSWLELKTGKPDSENISKTSLFLCSVFIKVAEECKDLPQQHLQSTKKGSSLFPADTPCPLPEKKKKGAYCSYALQIQRDPGEIVRNVLEVQIIPPIYWG